MIIKLISHHIHHSHCIHHPYHILINHHSSCKNTLQRLHQLKVVVELMQDESLLAKHKCKQFDLIPETKKVEEHLLIY